MFKLLVFVIFIFLFTIFIIVMANSAISSKLDKLNRWPSTYHGGKHRVTRKTLPVKSTKRDRFLQRFTTRKTIKEAASPFVTTTHRTITATINNTQISSFKGEWQCGTASISKTVTRNMIETDCPKLLNAVNSCCIVHDQCYDEQLGQEECDTGFCKCLKSVTLDTVSNSRCHKDHAPWFCEMVKAFGDSYYENAGLNTTLHSGFIDIFGEEARYPKIRHKRV